MIELRAYPWDIARFVSIVNNLNEPLEARADIDAVLGLLMRKSADSLMLSVHQDAAPDDSSEYVGDQLFRFYPDISARILTPQRLRRLIDTYPAFPQYRLLRYLFGPSDETGRMAASAYLYERTQSSHVRGLPVLSTYLRSALAYHIGRTHMSRQQLDSARLWFERSLALDSSRIELRIDYAALLRRADGVNRSHKPEGDRR